MTLERFFHENDRVALGFSGGVDSSYLLYAALKNGAQVRAYCVRTAFQPSFELEDATRLARQLRADLKILDVDVLSDDKITANPADRCYYCKKRIFSAVAAHALADGYHTLIDGTNASDDENDRPGMRAQNELNVRSPLRECGLSKTDIRRLSREANLFTWNKPAYACLATRIPAGEVITAEKLACTERAEAYLTSLGFRDFRVRMNGCAAKIQVPAAQMEQLFRRRECIVRELKKDYGEVLLDMEARDEQ